MATLVQSSSLSCEDMKYISPYDISTALNPFRIQAGLPKLDFQCINNYSETPDNPRQNSLWPSILIYCYGIPIAELREMFGVHSEHGPCFYGDIWDYWLQPSEDHWTKHSDVSPGFYEISLRGYFPNLAWESQEQKIRREFGSDCERASEHLLCEAFFSTWLLQEKGLLGSRSFSWTRSFLHWGRSLNSRGERLWLSLSGSRVTINAQLPSQPRPDLAVAISRHLDASA